MSPSEVITSYHDLWHVEQSFRITKTDLQARPMFHHTRDAIEAHLTVVFFRFALARHLQNTTGTPIRKIIRPCGRSKTSRSAWLASRSPPSPRSPQTPEPSSTR